MDAARIMDVDEERLLRHFCLEAECQQLLEFFEGQGFKRPEDFKERLALAAKIREISNKKFQASDFLSAMMHALSALHCVDFSQARCMLHRDEEKRELAQAIVPVLSNLSMIFLKRGDAYNAQRAADLGVDYAKRIQRPGDADAERLLAKLFFRRGLAKGQKKDFVEARADLREAARLQPSDREIRKALENCKAVVSQQGEEPDDQWRGIYTNAPRLARFRAKTARWLRRARALSGEVTALIRGPDGKKALLMLVGGPLLSFGLRTAFMSWAHSNEGKAPLASPEPAAATGEL